MLRCRNSWGLIQNIESQQVQMAEKTITCYFCFEPFEVSLEVGGEFSGANTEIYDCAVCCNPNKLHYSAYEGEISITDVTDGNE